MLKINNTNLNHIKIPLILLILGISGLFLFQYLTFIPEYSHAESISTENPEKTLMDIAYMQEMTPEVCARSIESTSSTGDTYQKQLIDSRDGKKYWVAKLKDGNCWMTQNLDYDIKATGITGDELTKTDLVESWTPDSKYPPTATVTSPFTNSGNDLALSYDPGERFCGENGNCSNNPSNDKHAISGENGHDAYGNYYTYVAATAGTGGERNNGDASGSICPKGWQLPTGSNNADKSFGKLLSGLTGNIITNKSGPYFYVYSGNINGYLNSTGNNGYYWSSTSLNYSVAYHLYFNYTRVSPSDTGDYRSFGYTIRCVNSNTNNNMPIGSGVNDPNISVTIPNIITLSIDSEVVDIDTSVSNPAEGSFTATVTSNSKYNLALSATADPIQNAHTDLKNDQNNASIPALSTTPPTITEANDSWWGIKCTNPTNSTNCTKTAYTGLTLTPDTYFTSTSSTPTTGTETPFTIGIKVSSNLPSGTYSTSIQVTASSTGSN